MLSGDLFDDAVQLDEAIERAENELGESLSLDQILVGRDPCKTARCRQTVQWLKELKLRRQMEIAPPPADSPRHSSRPSPDWYVDPGM